MRKVRTIRIEGDVAFVTLTRGYTAVIDAADVPLAEGQNWKAKIGHNTVYAVRNVKSLGHPSRRRFLSLHRHIMGEPEGVYIDHIDSDGLNNRRANLREATNAQNQYNQRLRSRNTSGIKGVSWSTREQKWQTSIRANGKQKFLGYFNCRTAAAITYAKASKALHGEFGRVA